MRRTPTCLPGGSRTAATSMSRWASSSSKTSASFCGKCAKTVVGDTSGGIGDSRMLTSSKPALDEELRRGVGDGLPRRGLLAFAASDVCAHGHTLPASLHNCMTPNLVRVQLRRDYDSSPTSLPVREGRRALDHAHRPHDPHHRGHDRRAPGAALRGAPLRLEPDRPRRVGRHPRDRQRPLRVPRRPVPRSHLRPLRPSARHHRRRVGAALGFLLFGIGAAPSGCCCSGASCRG